VLRRIGVRDLVVEGLTGNAFGAGLAVLGGAWAFADDILPGAAYERIADALVGFARRAGEQDITTAIAVGVAALVLFSLLSAAGAAIWSVVKFYGFTLTRAGDSLQFVYGLLTRRTSNLPRRRIQVVEIREGALRRLFGLASLRVETAGGAPGDEPDSQKEAGLLVPLLPRGEASSLLPLVLPDFDATEPRWRRVSSKAVGRGARQGAAVALVTAAALYGTFESPAALWALLFVPVAYVASLLDYRAYGYALEGRFLYIRRGWLGRSAHVVPVRNVQSVVVRRTPFDRRLGVGTLVVDTAGQTFGGRWCNIRNLPSEELVRLATQLAHDASRLRADVNRRSRPSAAVRS
jgi:putative membrane protein